MNKNILLGAIFSLIILPTVHVSESHALPQSGDQEVELSGSLFRPVGQRGGNLNLNGSYGYYLENPAWQIGIRQGYNLIHDRDVSDVWNLTTVPYVNYHFDKWGNVVPFIGTFVGAVYNDEDITGTIGPEAGVKSFLGESTFVSLRYRYEWFFEELDSGDVRDTTDANHVAILGIGYTWGGSNNY
jgi:hypothetical protein